MNSNDNYYGVLLILFGSLFFVGIYFGFSLIFFSVLFFAFVYSWVKYNDLHWGIVLILSLVIWLLGFVLTAAMLFTITEGEIIESQEMTSITFSDDTMSVHYLLEGSCDVRSTQFDNESEYFENKSKYLESEVCYTNKVSYHWGQLEGTLTEIECGSNEY